MPRPAGAQGARQVSYFTQSVQALEFQAFRSESTNTPFRTRPVNMLRVQVLSAGFAAQGYDHSELPNPTAGEVDNRWEWALPLLLDPDLRDFLRAWQRDTDRDRAQATPARPANHLLPFVRKR